MRISLAVVCLLFGLGGSGCGSNDSGTGGSGSTGGSSGTGGGSGSGGSGSGGSGGGGSSSTGGSSGSSSTLDPTAFGLKYKFADNEMSGWTADPSSPLWTGKGTDLEARIDGGNMAYVSRGCLVAMYQDLVEGAEAACEVVAMDFGTEANASAMVAYEQQLRGATVPIPQYDASTAIGAEILGGVTAYAHFKSLYFEVQLQGYADQSTAASVATQFLQKLQAKIP
jgi:hypothetical protein